MNDDCGQCPMCGEDLMFSKNKKLLYECSNAKCNYVEFQYQNMDKGKKKPGGLKMDIIEKWNFLIEYYNKNQTAHEKIIQQDWENLFAEIFGYSKLLKEVDAHRTMQIGATSRVIPDIIIRSTQENRDLFVVELKQHTILAGYEQLFSYLKLLKVDIGILICNKLYIYDYDTGKDDDNQSVLEIEFTKDNPDGIKFVELFSKGSFDKENIKQFIRERKVTKNNIQLIQDKIDQTLIYNLLKEHFTTHFSVEEFNEAVKDMKILIEKKKSVQNTTMVTTETVQKNNSIDKSSAIRRCQDLGISIKSNACTFSSQNQGHTGNNKYWANPDFKKLQDDWWLILNDTDRKQLYVFFIPSGEIKHNELRARKDKSHQIDIQIHYNDHHYPNFTDSISKLNFKRWLIKTIPY